VVVTTLLQVYQMRKSLLALERFRAKLPNLCQVIRDERVMEIDVTKLVPGDLVELVEGCSVPADLRMIVSRNLRVNTIYSKIQDR
jgi:P-type E1-E2 ATPase